MTRKLLKAGAKRKIAAKKGVKAAENGSVVLVGTYREKQLDWIKKNGVYNYPVKGESDGRARTPSAPQDDDLVKLASKVKELWLYAGAKAKRHCFAAEFVGIQTKAEFLAANPTYAKKVGKPSHAQYAVFKTKPFDYGPKLEGKMVVARAIDFATGRGQTKKIAASIKQFHADGEFAPLAAYLPSDLAKVPRHQLRVCEAAVQLSAWSPVCGMTPIQEKIASIVMCVAAFGRERGMSASDAYCYLSKYSGVAFLDEHYSMSRCYSEEMMDESLSKVCRNHGGTLK